MVIFLLGENGFASATAIHDVNKVSTTITKKSIEDLTPIYLMVEKGP